MLYPENREDMDQEPCQQSRLTIKMIKLNNIY